MAKSKLPAHEYPTCARHGKPRKDVRVRNYYLCDACRTKWQDGPFAGEAPAYEGAPIAGYCLLCNAERDDIRCRTWFLCDICHRVAASIGRNHVAEQAIVDFWDEKIKPNHPSLRLDRNDVSELRRYDPNATSGESDIDFLVYQGKTLVLAIENKTGRSPIRGTGSMSQFQLDQSDCDCITYAMNELHVPAYVIHAEVLERWKPPTVGFYCRSLWWSDIYRMRENYKSRKQRRDESRQAIYFGKKAFEAIDDFPAELLDGDELRLPMQFAERGPIQLYPDE